MGTAGFSALSFFTSGSREQLDDTAKGGLTILGIFYRDSLRALRFQTLIILLFEDRLVSN